MFQCGNWGGYVGSNDHVDKQRDPPPRPVAVEFPKYTPPFNPHALTHGLSSQLQYKICHSRSFTDVTNEDLESLNIKLVRDVPLSSFVPEGEYESRPLLYDDDLQAMINEISVENEDAFREVLRMQPLPGKKKPRIAYARNFFSSLEDMARYWDTEKDDYYRIAVDNSQSKSSTNSSADQKSSQTKAEPTDHANNDAEMSDVNTVDDTAGTKEVYKGYRISNAESMNPGARMAVTRNFLKMIMHKFNCRDHEPMPSPREKLIVRGVKIQSIQYHFCIARIPEDIKQARARQVEGPLMAVHVRDELRFEVKDGLLSPEKTGFVGERFDLLREVGCMLILASQRVRGLQRAHSTSNGTDNWWVSKPRWGGGPTVWGQLACDVFEEDDPSWSPEEKKLQEQKRKKQEDELNSKANLPAVEPKKLQVEDLLARTEKNTPATLIPSSQAAPLDVRPRKKKLRSLERPALDDPASMKDGRRLMYTPPFRKKWYQDWQRLRPNTSMHDDRIIPCQIGKESEDSDGFDDVYMVSSVNHHLCLIKMKVHTAYLDWLESGKEVPAAATSSDGSPEKNVLYVQRSGWYDVFDIEARKEFLIALWRVMCWLNRKHVPKTEFEKMIDKRKVQAEGNAD